MNWTAPLLGVLATIFSMWVFTRLQYTKYWMLALLGTLPEEGMNRSFQVASRGMVWIGMDMHGIPGAPGIDCFTDTILVDDDDNNTAGFSKAVL